MLTVKVVQSLKLGKILVNLTHLTNPIDKRTQFIELLDAN